MNRIEKRLEELKQENKKAFITYTTAGLPDLQTTAKLIFAQEEAGADILEIGVPFSDPVADGPVIQNASYQAIQKGTTLTKIFDMVEGVRKEKCEVPIVFMMYYNTVYHYGLDAFAARCIECGVDGLNFLIAILPEISKINDTGGILHHLMRMETVIHIHSISFTAAIERNFLIILQSYVSFPVD